MGAITNWKKNRQARIDAAKARAAGITDGSGKVMMDASKVDPRAKEFLEYTSNMLEEEYGVVSKEVRDQCCYDLFETMKRSFNAKALDPGADQDKFLMQMAKALKTAGILDETTQEDIIIRFLTKFKRIGGF